MAGEWDSYRDTVLDAARRAGNVPPPDLFVRYGVDPRQVRDAEGFTRRVEEVVKFWRTLKLQRKYLPLATALLAADTDLRRKSMLTLQAFTKQREERREQVRARLDARVTAIAAASPCVTIAGVGRLISAMGGAFDEQEVRAALISKGVAVVDPPWELHDRPPVSAAGSLRTALTALGYKLSAEVLFGAEAVRAGFRLRDGFRLTADGRTVTRDTIKKAQDEQARSKHDERKTAADSVLAILNTAAEDAERLHNLLQWEVQEQLRPDVAAGLPIRLVAQAAEELGLDATEAMELAATLVTDGGKRRDSGAAQLAAEALRIGELAEARRLLEGLPPNDATQTRAQLTDAERRVAELVAKAEGALATGDQEEAAALLTTAAEIAKDDEGLRARLADIPPPAPREVVASLDGARVTVRWTPSPARTAGLRYRVVRTSGAPAVSSGAGSVVAETTVNEAVDADPTVADPNYYTVFASRGGAWSHGEGAGPVELLPEVRDIVLNAGEHAVSGAWRAHPAAVETDITRTRRDASGKPATVRLAEPRASTFVDTQVEAGATYDYAFRAVYRTPAGQHRMSQQVVVSATPAAPPGQAEGFAHDVVQRNGSAVVHVSWRPPASGVVEIRGSPEKPEWPPGTLVSRAAAIAFGQPVSGEASAGGNGLVFPAPRGRVVLTAVTLAGDQARIGESIAISLVNPVSGLRGDRRGNQVWLRWVWPPDATLARIRWWPADKRHPVVPAGESEISAYAFKIAGGARVEVPPCPVVLSVQTVVRGGGPESVSSAVTTTVQGSRVTVTYAVRGFGLPGRRRHELVLTCDRSCRLPDLVVVHRADGILPLRPDSGPTIATVAATDIAPGSPVSVPLPRRVTPLSGLACFINPNSSEGDEVSLVPTSH